MGRKTILLIVALLLSAPIVGCSGSDEDKTDAPAQAARDWYVAVNTMEALEADALVCQSKREEFRREMETGSTFLIFGQLLLGGTVDIELDASEVEFSTAEQGEGRAIVESRGEMRAAVGGSVSSEILNERWLMVQENGEWKWCGDASETSVQKAEEAMSAESDETINTADRDEIALYPVRVNGAVGYLNRVAETVIEPQFANGWLFSEGLAAVVTDTNTRLWGFINTNGNVVIEPQYEEVMPFLEGLAAVRVDDTWGFINTRGEMVIEPKFYSPFSEGPFFSEGLAAVATDADLLLWGYIDTNGDFVIEPTLRVARSFTDGLAPASMTETRQSGFINTKGEFVIELPWGRGALGSFYEGMAPVGDSLLQSRGEPAYGFINREGEWVMGPRADFNSLRPFKDGYAAFAKKAEDSNIFVWGYINTEGEVVVEPQFLKAYDFYHGLAPVITPEGESGFVDPDGNWVFKND